MDTITVGQPRIEKASHRQTSGLTYFTSDACHIFQPFSRRWAQADRMEVESRARRELEEHVRRLADEVEGRRPCEQNIWLKPWEDGYQPHWRWLCWRRLKDR
jgi:hypothetical protein